MTFPYFLWLGPFKLHPHLIFELLAYSVGFQLWRLRSKRMSPNTPPMTTDHKIWLLVACVLGAAIGARLLAWLETPWDPTSGQWLMPGKTIAGGLLGGWGAIEFTKHHLGITYRTGDAYVLPLCIGIALGRIGCFLTGLDDHTYGIATSGPWAVDFGDGIPRHPTQLYEAVFLISLPVLAHLLKQFTANWSPGSMFQVFMAAYLAFRVGIEWIKPTLKMYAGMSAIQWASLLGMGIALYQLYRLGHSTSMKQQSMVGEIQP